MKDKLEGIEIKIYEALGIKTFRKMAFGLLYVLTFCFFWSKDLRNKIYNQKNTNYRMNRGHGLKDLRDFKKMLYFNALIHLWVLVKTLPDLLKSIIAMGWFPLIIPTLIGFVINGYCVMLQRYNYIKINRVLKHGKVLEQKKKDLISEELRGLDITKGFKYSLVKRGKEKEITLDEFLENATLSELKNYKADLEYIKNNYDLERDWTFNIPLHKRKTLKLTIRHN